MQLRSWSLALMLTSAAAYAAGGPSPDAIGPPARLAETPNEILIFNPNREIGAGGETQEFSTIENVKRVLRERGIQPHEIVLAVGDRSGRAGDPLGYPGEVIVHGAWGEDGDGLQLVSEEPASGRTAPLREDDVILFTIVMRLDPATGIELPVYDDPSRAGTVLWSFHRDESAVRIGPLRFGFFNVFSDVDGGLTEDFFKAAEAAREAPGIWATEEWRSRLAAHVPPLEDDRIWKNLSQSMHEGLLFGEWIPELRRRGHAGAAVVMRGSAMNVNTFRVKKINRTKPSDPRIKFKLDGGTPRFELPQEAGLDAEHDPARWTFVGLITDFENEAAFRPSLETWKHGSEAFGSGFHIHGYRQDGRKTGHVLTAMLGPEKLQVVLYPLDFSKPEKAMVHNNDLRLAAVTKLSDGSVRAVVENLGENFARDVGVAYRVRTRNARGSGTRVHEERVAIPLLGPREARTVEIVSPDGSRNGSVRSATVIVDPGGDFLEGGQGRENNVLDVD